MFFEGSRNKYLKGRCFSFSFTYKRILESFVRENDSRKRKKEKEKKKNTQNCGWSAILNASGVGMANIDIITPVYFSKHFSSTDHLTTGGMPYTAFPSSPLPFVNIVHKREREKKNQINKKSATQTQHPPTEVRLGRFSATSWEVVLSFLSHRWRVFFSLSVQQQIEWRSNVSTSKILNKTTVSTLPPRIKSFQKINLKCTINTGQTVTEAIVLSMSSTFFFFLNSFLKF